MGCKHPEFHVQVSKKNKTSAALFNSALDTYTAFFIPNLAVNVVRINEICSMWFFRVLKSHEAHKKQTKRRGALYAIVAGAGGQRVVLVRRRQHAELLRVPGEESSIYSSSTDTLWNTEGMNLLGWRT